MTPPGIGTPLRSLACTLGAHRVWQRAYRHKLLVVMYHGVTDDRAVARRWWHHVYTGDFEQQLRYLQRHYETLPLDDALRAHWSGGLERPTACITFDDGYLNNRTAALPVLERLGIPATIYLATGMIGTTRRLWTVELDFAFKSASATEVDLSPVGLGRQAIADRLSRYRVFEKVLGLVKEISPAERTPLLESLYEQLAAPDDPIAHEPFRMMQWNDAEQMAGGGLVTFGAHTVNHEIVSRLTSEDVQKEITESMAEVERRVSAVTKTFAYPNGGRTDFDSRAVAAVKTAGGIGAVTTVEGLCDAAEDHYAIKRIGVGSDTGFDQFRLLTSGAISDLKRLRLR